MPRPKAKISRLGWGLLIAQAILIPLYFVISAIVLADYYPSDWGQPSILLSVGIFLLISGSIAFAYSMCQPEFTLGRRLLHIFIAWLIGIFLLAFILPNFIAVDVITSQGKVMQGLHAIQLAVERYATDNEGGYYPDYILGGTYEDDYVINEEYYKEAFNTGENPLGGTSAPPPAGKFALLGSGDWVNMEGYMPSYPHNPFRRKATSPQTIPAFPPGPYRNASVEQNMAQIAADHRFPGALIGERYWERGKNSTLKRLLAGNFIYKGLIPPGEKHPRGYILMVFGGPEDKGEDALTTIPGGHELDGRLQDGSGVGMGVPVIPELGIKGDGKPDGIILVLTGGWPFEETKAKDWFE